MTHAKVVLHSKAWLASSGEAGQVFALVELYDRRCAVVAYSVGFGMQSSRLEVLDQWHYLPTRMRAGIFEKTFRSRSKLNIRQVPGRAASRADALSEVELAPAEHDVRRLEALLWPSDGERVAHLAWAPGSLSGVQRWPLESVMREALGWFAADCGFLEQHLRETEVLSQALERGCELAVVNPAEVVCDMAAVAGVLSIWGQLYVEGPLELLRSLSNMSSSADHFSAWQSQDAAAVWRLQHHLDSCLRRKEVSRDPARVPLRLPVRVWLQEAFSPAVPVLKRALESTQMVGA